MSRNCSCGCDSFRFRLRTDKDIFNNICHNCGHTLIEHTNLVKKQAE